MRVVFSRLAEADLEAIGDYIAADNPKKAVAFIKKMQRRCDALATAPDAHPLRPELLDGVRACIHGKYIIFYRHIGREIVIDRILHGARDIAGLFKRPE